MNKRRIIDRAIMISALIVAITAISTNLRADSGTCGGQMITLPFADVAGSTFFCQIAEAYFSGLTNGTSATTYSPAQNVTRDQMAAFITRTLDQETRRASYRAALDQWWQGSFSASGMTDVSGANSVKSDGEDLWVTSLTDGTVTRVRASDGRVLGTWTGADGADGVVVARGRIFITGETVPGSLYRIDPKQAPGPVAVVTNSLGNDPRGITADESLIWTANYGGGSVSKINPNNGAVTTFTAGFTRPEGIIYDGSNVWVTDNGDGALKKLDSNGTVVQAIPIGNVPHFPAFDGTNLWVPDSGFDQVVVVRVKDSQGNPLAQPFVVATLTGNGLNGPFAAAFDGQRILVTNFSPDKVSLWRATDLAPLGSYSIGLGIHGDGACSDGINFWVTAGRSKLARF